MSFVKTYIENYDLKQCLTVPNNNRETEENVCCMFSNDFKRLKKKMFTLS